MDIVLSLIFMFRVVVFVFERVILKKCVMLEFGLLNVLNVLQWLFGIQVFGFRLDVILVILFWEIVMLLKLVVRLIFWIWILVSLEFVLLLGEMLLFWIWILVFLLVWFGRLIVLWKLIFISVVVVDSFLVVDFCGVVVV